jgi:hypothetical protein
MKENIGNTPEQKRWESIYTKNTKTIEQIEKERGEVKVAITLEDIRKLGKDPLRIGNFILEQSLSREREFDLYKEKEIVRNSRASRLLNIAFLETTDFGFTTTWDAEKGELYLYDIIFGNSHESGPFLVSTNPPEGVDPKNELLPGAWLIEGEYIEGEINKPPRIVLLPEIIAKIKEETNELGFFFAERDQEPQTLEEVKKKYLDWKGKQ